MTTHRRNKHGEILCTDCGGEGEVEVALGHPNDPDAPHAIRTCPRCDGSTVEECCMCGDPAKIHGGKDPRFLYCSPTCAAEDDNATEHASAASREVPPREPAGLPCLFVWNECSHTVTVMRDGVETCASCHAIIPDGTTA